MTSLVKTFDARVGALSGDGQAVAAIISAAADLALIIDEGGVVRDIAYSGADAQFERCRDWLGHAWADTVTTESRAKVDEMLSEVQASGVSRRRQVNQAFGDGVDVPVAYTAVRLGGGRMVAAIGRDLRALGQLQQRLVEAQQALERDYWRMRHIETRYRLLFQLSAEAVLIVDAGSHKVIEANPAAGHLFGSQPRTLVGRAFPFGLEASSQRVVTEHLATVRTHGKSEPVRIVLSDGRAAQFSAALVRQDSSTLFLLRVIPEEQDTSGARDSSNARVAELLEHAPDAFVVTDLEGNVLTANRSFLDLAQLGTQEQARGQSVGTWVGRPGADLSVLLATLREHGVVRLFSTTVRGELGSTAEVELSAVAATNADEPCIGLTLRDVGRRLAASPQGAQDLTRAVEQLTGLVGRVSLRELVRDTVDLVERHFIEAALELTQDNRTSAAEVLGVSRQSLYVKLRRYNLGAGLQGPSAAE